MDYRQRKSTCCDTASSFPRRPPPPAAGAAVPGRLRARTRGRMSARTPRAGMRARVHAASKSFCALAQLECSPMYLLPGAAAAAVGPVLPSWERMLCCTLERLWPRRRIALLSRLREPHKKFRITNMQRWLRYLRAVDRPFGAPAASS